MKVSELKQQMDERFDSVDQRFVSIDQRFVSIDQRFVSIDQQFADIRQDMDRRFTAVEARIVEEGQITRRHFDVVAEDLRREIRTLTAIVAEGQRTLDQNRSEHRTFSAALSDHELRLLALEHRHRPKP